MKIASLKSIFTILSFALVLASCSETTDPFFQQIDFSTVPAPMDFSEYERFETERGVGYYILKEGSGQITVQPYRDGLRLFFTLRTEDGEILQSTYANGRQAPEERGVESFNTQGARDGVIGMKTGETRVLVVPPELGFGNTTQNDQFYQYREDTLIYEIELLRILD